MGLYYDLPLYKDSYKLVQTIIELTSNFKREYKYTLAQDMVRTSKQLVLCLFRANSALDKREDLRAFGDYLELLKLDLRLCVDMRLISPTQHSKVWEQLEKIGRQLTGWRKAQDKKQ